MQPLASDTPAHIEAEILAVLRAMTPAEKGQRITELCAALDQLTLVGIRLRQGVLNNELELALLRLDHAQRRRASTLLAQLPLASPANPVAIAVRIGQILGDLGIPYVVGGSFASAIHGEFRTTRDIDVIIPSPNGPQAHVLATTLRAAFTFYEQDLYDAVARRADPDATFVSVALYDQETGYQVDLFLAVNEPYMRLQLRRARRVTLAEGEVSIPTVEDSILAKLRWYAISPSGMQWRDVQGMLRVQQGIVDVAYLHTWGRGLGIEALVKRALAGEEPRPPDTARQPPLC